MKSKYTLLHLLMDNMTIDDNTEIYFSDIHNFTKQALMENGNLIQYISCPDESLQILSVKNNVASYKYIANPTKAVTDLVIAKYETAIEQLTKRKTDLADEVLDTLYNDKFSD